MPATIPDIRSCTRIRHAILSADPRWYQILALSALLFYGMTALDFDVSPVIVVIILTVALATQAIGNVYASQPFESKSAIISSLSLCLLLRPPSPLVAALAALLAIASKFLLRWNGKHVWNPTNFALTVILALGLGWVSPGQWGRSAWLAFAVVCAGSLVVNRAARSDVTIAFLLTYAGLWIARAQWLGDPLEIPLHRLENGALLIFAFFMISDPKTTPDSRAGRLIFAGVVSLTAFYLQTRFYQTNALLWALAAGVLTVPLLDRWLPGRRYVWGVAPFATPPSPAGLSMGARTIPVSH